MKKNYIQILKLVLSKCFIHILLIEHFNWKL